MNEPLVLSRAMNGDQAADYVKALSACQLLADLRELVSVYAELAVDAVVQVRAMTEADWPVFQKGLKTERRGKFAGEDFVTRFGAILMPLPMMRISVLADQFKAPFGVAWARCRDLRPDLLKVEIPR